MILWLPNPFLTNVFLSLPTSAFTKVSTPGLNFFTTTYSPSPALKLLPLLPLLPPPSPPVQNYFFLYKKPLTQKDLPSLTIES